MNNKVQIALLSVIAIALVAIAIGLFAGKETESTSSKPIVAANTNNPAPATAAAAGETFDPLASNDTPVDNTPKTTMNFEKYEHDFGNIKQDSENPYTFKFTNTGTEPLIIESATGSCGCTVPEYPKHPIAPGASENIKVVYKPGKQENAQTKTVTIVANTEPKETQLRIKANVEKVG